MSNRTSTNLKIASITLFVVGLVSVGVVYAIQNRPPQRRHPKAFTIVTKETITMNDPTMQAEPGQADYIITTRYQKSDGSWKEERTKYKGDKVIKKTVGFGIPGRGVFQIDSQRAALDFISAMPPKEITSFITVTNGHENERFVRDEIVQGYQTYVLHYLVDKDGSYQDEYYAPDLDGQAIKSIKVAPYGSSITELISVSMGEPDERVFASLPNWIVNYDKFKGKIQALEDDGNHAGAEALRNEMKQHMLSRINQ